MFGSFQFVGTDHKGWKGGVGGLQFKSHRVPPTQQVPSHAIGLCCEVVAEVVLLVAGQKPSGRRSEDGAG
jgi:hypothetical protein